jgi:hypothetical protein
MVTVVIEVFEIELSAPGHRSSQERITVMLFCAKDTCSHSVETFVKCLKLRYCVPSRKEKKKHASHFRKLLGWVIPSIKRGRDTTLTTYTPT